MQSVLVRVTDNSNSDKDETWELLEEICFLIF